MSKQAYVAFDLGAESGRSMLAIIDNDKLTLEETHRFLNLPQRLPAGLHWNLLDLWANLLEGLKQTRIAAEKESAQIVAIGVDTWGVDFGLIGESGDLLGLPHAYRDERNNEAYGKTIAALGEDTIYKATGIQFMPFNTLIQLFAAHAAEAGLLAQAKQLLFIPDLLHYFFCGNMAIESTIASTSQLIDPRTGKWATQLLDQLGIPSQYLTDPVPAGTVIGDLLPNLAKDAGFAEGAQVKVIAPATHDTGAAIAAVPVDVDTAGNWAYLSSGTWSLMGAELTEPCITDKSQEATFTNEGGVDGTIRFLKNIAGLWLVQECRRDFEKNGNVYDYVQLTQMASEAEPFRTLVNPDHAPFLAPGDMPAKIQDFAKQTGQPIPETPGQLVRCCLESLAMAYRYYLKLLEGVLDKQFDTFHIVGGGGKNALLNQMTADAINIPVIVGPYEATAIGNALTQALGTKQVNDLKHLRQIVRNSFDLETCIPTDPASFDAQYDRYLALLK